MGQHHRRPGRKDGRGGRLDDSKRDGGFTCINCRAHVPYASFGVKHRNHCPSCLWSRHVDETIGDRQSFCRGSMEPIAVAVSGSAHEGGEWKIVHRCTSCGQLRTNRIAGDDSERSLLSLALRPIAMPAFPIDDVRT